MLAALRAGFILFESEVSIMQSVSPYAFRNILRCLNALAYFLFVWLYVKPDLLYYSVMPNGQPIPVFQTGMKFFLSSIRQPLGPVDYFSALLSQSLAVAWLGALVTALLAAVAYACILSIGRRIAGRSADLVGCVPGLLGLLMIGDYRDPVLALTVIDLALAAALLVAAAVPWNKFRIREAAVRFDRRYPKFLPSVRSSALALAATALVAAVVVFNAGDRTRARLSAYACLGRWNDIIATVNKLPLKAMDAATAFDLDAALFHTGRLGDEMLRYPQFVRNAFDGALPAKSLSFPAQIRFARFHYELGAVNNAQKALYEIFVNETEHPYVLDFMAQIHLVKGQAAAAEMIYRRLLRDPVYRDRAAAMLHRLESDTTGLLSETIVEKRAQALVQDAGIYRFNLKQLCLDLLERNSHNRMAFEYLMAICLLSGDLREFVDYLARFGASFSGPLPRHWAEALAMYNEMSPPGERRFGDQVPQEIVDESSAYKEAFLSIKETCIRQGVDEQEFRKRAYDGLRQQFGNTVLFFYFFQESGAVKWGR